MDLREKSIVLLLCVTAAFSCSGPPDTSVPEGAFKKMAPCADRQDAKCLFHCLDRDSRWSVHTIFKTLVKMREIVEKSYPEAARKGVFGSWEAAAGASDAETLFVTFCAERNCLQKLSEGFAAVESVTPAGPDRVQLTTLRKKAFGFRRADGTWGLDTYHDELAAAKLRLLDRLKEVERNAAVYEEQKLAGGGPV